MKLLSNIKEQLRKYNKLWRKRNSKRVKFLRDKYYREHKEILLKQQRHREKRNLKSWEGFIPVVAKCEICNKDIFFNRKNSVSSIHFDHANENNESIRGNPSQWLRRKNRTPENELVWKTCNFGYLCMRCNQLLPTKHRKLWLKKATKYTNNH